MFNLKMSCKKQSKIEPPIEMKFKIVKHILNTYDIIVHLKDGEIITGTATDQLEGDRYYQNVQNMLSYQGDLKFIGVTGNEVLVYSGQSKYIESKWKSSETVEISVKDGTND